MDKIAVQALIDYNRNRVPVSKDFMLREFECRGIQKGMTCCGGLAGVDPINLNALQKTRDYINKPLSPSSGFRCVEYNKCVGGKPASRHLVSLAVDLPCAGTGLTPDELADILLKFGVVRVAIYTELKFVHMEGYDRYTDSGVRYDRRFYVPKQEKEEEGGSGE